MKPEDFMNATTTISPAERVGILLGPVGDLNTRVVRFLSLYLNTLQDSLEFEFVPEPPDSTLLTVLASAEPVDRNHVRQLAGQFLDDYHSYWVELRDEYELLGTPPPRIIILTTARFSDNYYVTVARDVGVIALGNWERYMAPPSLVEFFIFVTLRTAVGLIDKRLYNSVHLGTKGCLWDFTPSLDDVRYKILVGTLCSQCSATLKGGPLSRLTEQLPQIMNKAWLGKREDPLSPAAISAKLGYDLFVAKGPSATLRESIVAALQQEGPKEALRWVFAFLLTAVLVWAGLKTP